MIYNLTHYDLDGVCSAILIRHFIGETKVFPTGYNKVRIAFQNLLNKKPKYMIITDLDFDQELVNYMIGSNIKYLYIDHHKTQFRNPKTHDNVDFYINQKFCATADILKYFKNKGKPISDKIKKLAYYANDYDMWFLKTQESQILNYIFWTQGFESFLNMFKNGYEENIVESYRKEFENNKLKIKKYFDDCKKEEFEFDNFKCLNIYASKYISDITLMFPNYDYYFIVSDPRKMSVRTKTKNSLENAFKIIGEMPEISISGCHEFAGGINLKTSLSDEKCTEVLLNCMETILKDVLIPLF